MKDIIITMRPNGTLSVKRPMLFATETRTTSLTVDFSLVTDLMEYDKYVDLLMADGSTLTIPAEGSQSVDQIQTFDLTSAVTKVGPLKIQPWASAIVDGNLCKMIFQPVVVEVSSFINNTHDAEVLPDTLVTLIAEVSLLRSQMANIVNTALYTPWIQGLGFYDINLYVYFNKPMEEPSLAMAQESFTITVNGENYPITSILDNGNGMTMMGDTPISNDAVVTLSYSGNWKSYDGYPVMDFTDLLVKLD
jgi:hypothetical protein